MQYDFAEIHTLNMLHSDPMERQRFQVPRDLTVAAWLVVFTLVMAVTAAIVMKVDKVVPAKGVLETPLGLFTVRNMQSGYVQDILVRAGSVVSAGQELVRFDTRQIDLEISKIQSDMTIAARKAWADATMVQSQLQARDKASLVSKLEGITNPNEMPGYSQRLHGQASTVQEIFTAGLEGAASRSADLVKQRELQLQAIYLQQDELTRSQRLVDDGFESPMSLLAKRRSLLEAQAREKALHAEMQALSGEMDKLRKEQERQLGDLALDQLRRIDSAISDFRRAALQLELLEKTKQRLTVFAPFNGVVDQIALRGSGEFVAENTALATLRESVNKDAMEIEITLPGSLAVWVKPGMKFRASAAGNNPEDHGFVRGEVSFVSNSSTEKNEVLYYRMRGMITEFSLKGGIATETFMRPGMDLRVEIITGTRNVMSYILDPFEKTLREAITEPN